MNRKPNPTTLPAALVLASMLPVLAGAATADSVSPPRSAPFAVPRELADQLINTTWQAQTPCRGGTYKERVVVARFTTKNYIDSHVPLLQAMVTFNGVDDAQTVVEMPGAYREQWVIGDRPWDGQPFTLPTGEHRVTYEHYPVIVSRTGTGIALNAPRPDCDDMALRQVPAPAEPGSRAPNAGPGKRE